MVIFELSSRNAAHNGGLHRRQKVEKARLRASRRAAVSSGHEAGAASERRKSIALHGDVRGNTTVGRRHAHVAGYVELRITGHVSGSLQCRRHRRISRAESRRDGGHGQRRRHGEASRPVAPQLRGDVAYMHDGSIATLDGALDH
jgi:hypothetical protein